MQATIQDDDYVMSLLEQALSRPPEERRQFLVEACGADTESFDVVWAYLQQEERMGGFLLDPLLDAVLHDEVFHPGDCIEGRFRILRRIAEGGMGVVYEAWDDRLDRRLAIKCARPGHSSRLPPEVRNASEISHPNVCRIFEIHTAQTVRGPVDFITMEFLEGETLSERLRRGPLPEETALKIGRQLCAGLAEAHTRHVIHGDLKASNVVLTDSPDGTLRAVITDFGLAQRGDGAENVAQSARHGGTPDYMAPELWEGQKASVRSDIYALGIILYQLAAGHPPFRTGPHVTPEERLGRRPPPVSPRWDRVLARCLQPLPTQRFDSAREVALALEPPASRRRLVAAGIAALLLASATGVVSYRYAASPAERVRLSVLHTSGSLEPVLTGTLRHLRNAKGTARTGFELLGGAASESEAKTRFQATHILSGSLAPDGEQWQLTASITDAGTRAVVRQWAMRYRNDELRFAPLALAGFVTSTLHLTPVTAAGVNPAALSSYQEGATYVRQRVRTDEAIGLLRHALSLDPESPLIWAALGEAQFSRFAATQKQSWFDDAAESARQAMLRNPDLGPVHRLSGILLQRSGKYDDATAEFTRAAEVEPGDSENFRRLGLAYLARGKWEEAKLFVRKGAEMDPGNYRLWWDLGAVYHNMGDYASAAPLLKKAADMGPPGNGARRVLVLAYVNLGDFANAEAEIRTQLNQSDTPESLRTLGRVLFYQGREREAIPHLEQAAKEMPDAFEYWNELGNCYRRAGRAADARRVYARAIDLAQIRLAKDPNSGQMRSYVAVLAAYLGDSARAQAEIAQAVAAAPDQFDVQFNAALAFEHLGQRDKTLAVIRKATRQTLSDMSRWPDLVDLGRDPRFVELLESSQQPAH